MRPARIAINLGGHDVTAALAGKTLNFPASFADAAAIGFAGIGFNHEAGGAWTLNASLEGRYGNNAYSEIRTSAVAAMKF